jgi:hypothetical protein
MTPRPIIVAANTVAPGLATRPALSSGLGGSAILFFSEKL